MLVKRKYNIGEQVKIQTQNDDGPICFVCTIMDSTRVQSFVNGDLETIYRLQTINSPTLYFYRSEDELELMNPKKNPELTEFDECYEMQNILLRLETKLSDDKPFSDFEKCKIHDAWVAVKSMEEYLNLKEIDFYEKDK